MSPAARAYSGQRCRDRRGRAGNRTSGSSRGPGPFAFADGPKVARADYKGADPTGVPASLAKASDIERGAYLARAADCVVCHTAKGGKDYAGGLGFKIAVRHALLGPTSRPTKKPVSAITAIRIFSTPFIAASAAMACGFIRRCRLRPTPP